MKRRAIIQSKRDERYTAYDAFAQVYEKHWSSEVPPQLWTIIERLLVPHLPEKARVLDLCCGTGYTTAKLAERGFDVTGLDGSKEMLRRARRLAPAARFVLKDARRFDSKPLYHAVVSTFDSLNHVLTLHELTQVFRNVYKALLPAGFFLFDMNMEQAFLQHWADYYAIVEDTNACILRGTYDRRERIGRYDITTFERTGELWQRADTVIYERCYTARQITRALKTAGFTKLSSYDAARDLGLTEHTGRRFFLARKEA
ncbi:MAG: class I SAM-dependent DNA methyltransferase [Pyrinomonadaceae bacterium]